MPIVRAGDGQSIYVRVVGQGTPVVMLAGLGMTSMEWLPYVAPFTRRFRFFMPDYRGFGRSMHAPMRSADLFDSHVADVRDIVEHFGLRDHLLVGYSLGGSTSLHLQRDHGFGNVRRYLHIDQSPFVGTAPDWRFGLVGDRQPDVAAILRRALAIVDANLASSNVSRMPADARRELASTLGELAKPLSLAAAVTPTLRTLFALPSRITQSLPLTSLPHLRVVLSAYARAEHDYRESLRRCDTPITVLVGMRSGLYDPRGQAAIADYATNARVLRFERSGHLPIMQEPRRFVRELGAFLDGN